MGEIVLLPTEGAGAEIYIAYMFAAAAVECTSDITPRSQARAFYRRQIPMPSARKLLARVHLLQCDLLKQIQATEWGFSPCAHRFVAEPAAVGHCGGNLPYALT